METPIYVQCPKFIESPRKGFKSIFLAGGITNCPLWQDDLKNKLFQAKLSNLVIFNPRRAEDFDFDKESHFQIEWEFNYLRQSDAVSFWFTKESICPITLFELGTCLKDKYKVVFVGCHPEYPRKNDLYIQTSLYRPEIQITDDMEKLFEQIKQWYQKETSQTLKNKDHGIDNINWSYSKGIFWFGFGLLIAFFIKNLKK